jgi:hypothetical protein
MKVSFTASIPPSPTAIKIHGEGGARIMFDIAEKHLQEFIPAFAMRGKIVKVTIEHKEEKE